jgi:hypothetical protein
MNPSQRTLTLALVLGVWLSCTGKPTHFFERAQARATKLALRAEVKAADLLAYCTPCALSFEVVPNLLERLGVPTELVRERQ